MGVKGLTRTRLFEVSSCLAAAAELQELRGTRFVRTGAVAHIGPSAGGVYTEETTRVYTEKKTVIFTAATRAVGRYASANPFDAHASYLPLDAHAGY